MEMPKRAQNDLAGPIPPNTTRISVKFGEWLYLCDYPTAKVVDGIAEFEEFAGPVIREARAKGRWKGDEGASSIARYAREAGEHYILAFACLWMFCNRPNKEEGRKASKLLAEFVERDGGAWLTASTDDDGKTWDFVLSPVSLSRIQSSGKSPLFPATGKRFH